MSASHVCAWIRMRFVVEIKIRVRSKFPPIEKPQAGLGFTALWGVIGIMTHKQKGKLWQSKLS